MTERPAASDFPIAILGAGFAGIGAAIQLQKAGIDSFTVFERAEEVGGTWRDNTYPGAACDVPSHVYSFSFEPNPHWSRGFAESGEIQRYLLQCVEKHGLREKIRFGTAIVHARFDEATGTWQLTTSADQVVRARVVISGIGGLVDPKLPDIKGLQSFRGELFHTARWNHDSELTGKRVAVIGTGASAVQVVPAIAPQAEKLSVFQRTAAWVVPKADWRIDARRQQLYARYPALQKLVRWMFYLASELQGPLIFLDAPWLSRLAERRSLQHLEASVKDPVLREKLRPTFQFGCKRILISDDYWSTFERENVELITDPIEEIHADWIETRAGSRYEADAIVLATGFELGLASAPFPIVGREGLELSEVWKRGAVAYKGMAVSGFPNWFILMGPNTGPGHTSVLVYTEAQIQHALEAIREIRGRGLRYVEVRQEVQDRYNESLQHRMKYMVWSSGCSSWYLSEDGSNHALFPGFASEYVLRARHFRSRDYWLVPGGGGAPPPAESAPDAGAAAARGTSARG